MTPAVPLLVVPAYFHPAVRPQDWSTLAGLAHRVRLVILNVASGPGTRRDPSFDGVLDELRRGGIAVAGYVDTDYGRRPGADVLADLARYRRWYPAERAVFFDRVTSSADHVDHYARLARAARALGTDTVAFNHGVHPAPAYAEHADLLGTFEGPWTAYRRLVVPAWARAGSSAQFLHLVHSVPRLRLGTARELAARRNAGCAYVTDVSITGRGEENPWRRLCAGTRRAARPDAR